MSESDEINPFHKPPPPTSARSRRNRKARRRSAAEESLRLLSGRVDASLGRPMTQADRFAAIPVEAASVREPDPLVALTHEAAMEFPRATPRVARPGVSRVTQSPRPAGSIALLSSPRFKAHFDEASPGLQHLAYQEVHALLRRLQADPATGFNDYQSVRGLPRSGVRELKLGGGPRLLATYRAGTVTLLDMGRHEVTEEYSVGNLRRDLTGALPADRLFASTSAADVNSIFGSNPDRRQRVYGTELSSEWIYFLATPQNAFVHSCLASYKRATLNRPAFRFAVGGPGTGKTSILLKLFIELRKLGGKPGLLVADPLADYIERASGVILGSARIPLRAWQRGDRDFEGFDVLLFDDPPHAESIHSALLGATGTVRLAVVGFDPYQLTGDMSDTEYQALIDRCDAKVRELRVCYRQKENVGRAARRVMDTIARATPFLAERRVEWFHESHSRLSRLANDARYPNPHGYEQTYIPGTTACVRRELNRMRASPVWTHSPPLLLVLDTHSSASEWDWPRLLAGMDYQRIDIAWNHKVASGVWDKLSEVKGLEFQHVLIVLSLPAFAEMDIGFAGSGRNNYLARRLARIPFSRAKDSLVNLCVGPADLTAEYAKERATLHAFVTQFGLVETYKLPLLRKVLQTGIEQS